ncbi:MAG: hypothetical protein JRI71_10755 [Deltaproteobacteria bacterium]|nr:hypothetical protein [Deltaproteobacteria bacterium]MBW2078007.1 hypothetical protein [Deltaproteobacteria bacterium]
MIYGTQKCVRDVLWAEHCLQRDVGTGDDTQMQYYGYVLEAALAFHDGMTIPLMSEFLSYTQADTDNRRQGFEWVNNIEYYYGPHEMKKQIVHVVVCEETWQKTCFRHPILDLKVV